MDLALEDVMSGSLVLGELPDWVMKLDMLIVLESCRSLLLELVMEGSDVAAEEL